ncbi:MAG: hypothetical protein ACUVTZ_00845 [Armatimonadota bacterium]
MIQRLYPLADVIADSQIILFGKVNRTHPEYIRIGVERVAKGRHSDSSVSIVTSTVRATDAQILRRKLAADAPVVLFIVQTGAKRVGLGYTEGIWFHIEQELTSAYPDWKLVGAEPYLVRTYRGPTEDLKKTVLGVLAGKVKAPPPDPQAVPHEQPRPSGKQKQKPPPKGGRTPTALADMRSGPCQRA